MQNREPYASSTVVRNRTRLKPTDDNRVIRLERYFQDQIETLNQNYGLGIGENEEDPLYKTLRGIIVSKNSLNPIVEGWFNQAIKNFEKAQAMLAEQRRNEEFHRSLGVSNSTDRWSLRQKLMESVIEIYLYKQISANGNMTNPPGKAVMTESFNSITPIQSSPQEPDTDAEGPVKERQTNLKNPGLDLEPNKEENLLTNETSFDLVKAKAGLINVWRKSASCLRYISISCLSSLTFLNLLPFLPLAKLPPCLKELPFAVAWEVYRVANYCNLTDEQFEVDPRWGEMRYTEFWESLMEHPSFKGKLFPGPAKSEAWEAAKEDKNFEIAREATVHFTAKAEFTTKNSEPLFKITLNPINATLGHRLGRKFGHDKFLEVLFPTFERSNLPARYSKDPAFPNQIVRWLCMERHEILGQYYAVFFTKNTTHKKRFRGEHGNPVTQHEFQQRIFLYREGGSDLCDRVSGMLDWLLCLNENKNQSYLKLFSRISLGVSRTRSTVLLDESQIRYRNEDIKSKGTVMNDGCARMSRGLARRIIQMLNLDYNPCAFQGRFGSAKGMWIVDVSNEDWDGDKADDIWIETYPSQRKWKCTNTADPFHRTFEVRNYVPAVVFPAQINTQLIPVLLNGAISKEAMKKCLEQLLKDFLNKELEKLEVAMKNPTECLRWISQLRSSKHLYIDSSALDADLIPFSPFLGSFPNSDIDQMRMLLESGFHPLKQQLLQDLVTKVYEDQCERLGQELKFKIGCSAYLFMLADMEGVLKNNEVHVNFSEAFKDEFQFNDTILDKCDVLVARAPIHLPSDIQRVRAVFRPELRKLKNVIIFSTQGEHSLASKLSGGDYDGDLAWVCWNPHIVKNFENTSVPACPDLKLEKDEDTLEKLCSIGGTNVHGGRKDEIGLQVMIERGLLFNCRGSLLGVATTYKERFCYAQKNIATDKAILLSHLLSQLVDQTKQGIIVC